MFRTIGIIIAKTVLIVIGTLSGILFLMEGFSALKTGIVHVRAGPLRRRKNPFGFYTAVVFCLFAGGLCFYNFIAIVRERYLPAF